ncbi:hypothetical protein GWK47_043851 [Chionoecetes opilio]|uniref:Uncharacterized protein n=1 Tax=Chionoecetes opilio TaxID=41210 RepID=A0A8J4Y7W8_CHIOP|nr:hypothetical protein GWK47_043851 [Chionoecetes opilio]
MFSPERFGVTRASFGVTEASTGRNFIGLKTAFRPKDSRRTPLQMAAHFRFSEPATPSVQDGRGWRPSDLSDPNKKQLLTELTGRIFHLAANGETEDGERKISLERLFTPATDSGDLTPHKKAFASSSFYRPDHPTMDDQVELAQRISFSLVDENNKKSRGQSMYMKRKKRSMRWIHAAEPLHRGTDTSGHGAVLRSSAPLSLRRVAAHQFVWPTLWTAQYRRGRPGFCLLPGSRKVTELRPRGETQDVRFITVADSVRCGTLQNLSISVKYLDIYILRKVLRCVCHRISSETLTASYPSPSSPSAFIVPLAAVMPVRAGWVPCVGIQPPKPMVVMIDEADAIAEECERAFHTPPINTATAPVTLDRSGEGGDGQEEDYTLKHPPAAHRAASVPAVQQVDAKKPAMKLLMNPKGVQDFHAVQEHYQNLMDSAVLPALNSSAKS